MKSPRCALYRAVATEMTLQTPGGETLVVPAGPVQLAGPGATRRSLASLVSAMAPGLSARDVEHDTAMTCLVLLGDSVVVEGPFEERHGLITPVGMPRLHRLSEAGARTLTGEAAARAPVEIRSAMAASRRPSLSAWPKRQAICGTCRAVYGEREACKCGGEQVTLQQVAVSGALPEVVEVGPIPSELPVPRHYWLGRGEVSRERKDLMVVGRGFLAAACVAALAPPLGMSIVMTSLVVVQLLLWSWPRKRLPAPPQPALLVSAAASGASASARLPGAKVADTGVIRSMGAAPALLSGPSCVACAVELRSSDPREPRPLLRCAMTVGFRIETDDGVIIAVPAGRISLDGPFTQQSRGRVEPLLDWLFPSRSWATNSGPLAYETAHQLVLRDGDRVRVRGQTRSAADRRSAAGLYRDAVPTLEEPVGLFEISLLSE